MKTQHIAITRSGSYALKLYKLSGESLKELPIDTTGIGSSVVKTAFSPDGKWLVLLRRLSTGADRVHLWHRPDLNSDDYVKIAVPDLPQNATPSDVAFISNEEIVVLANKTTFGAINPTTGEITWSIAPEDVGNTTRDLRTSVHVIEPGRQIITNNLSTSTVGTFQYYKNTSGVWTRIGSGVGANGRAIALHSPGVAMALVGPSSSNSMAGVLVDIVNDPPSAITTSASGGALRLYNSSLDGVAISLATANLRPAFSHDKAVFFAPMTESPWIAVRRVDDPRAPPLFAGQASFTFPEVSLLINQIVMAIDNIIFVSFGDASTTSGLGRIRAFRYRGREQAPVEIAAISNMFNTGGVSEQSAMASVAVSIEQEENAPQVQVYDGVIAGLINRSIPYNNVGIALLTSAAVFNQTDTDIATVLGANEAYSTSWPQGGVTASYSGVEVDGSTCSFKLIIPSVAMTTGESLTFRSMVVFDKTSGRPIAFVRFDADTTVDNLKVLALAPVNNDLFTFTVTQND